MSSCIIRKPTTSEPETLNSGHACIPARKQVIGLQYTICRTLARYSVFLHQQQLGTQVFKYPKVRALAGMELSISST